MKLRVFMAVDALAHVLHQHRLLPRWAMGAMCDRFEAWLTRPVG